MKKGLLLTLLSFSCLILIAQERIPLSNYQVHISRETVLNQDLDGSQIIEKPVNPVTKFNRLPPIEEEVGGTFFDLQTNAAVQNRITRFNDGTFGLVYSMGHQPTAYGDRGTGYNYFDGTSWIVPPPATRIEGIRTGWPSHAALGVNGEIVVAHAGGTLPLRISQRDIIGTGVWNASDFAAPTGVAGLLWPRLATGGTDNSTIHLIALTTPVANGGTIFMGQDGALLYSRSTDAGLTWDIHNVILPGMDSTKYRQFRADDYAIAAEGDNVAILVGSKWHDIFLMKSNDNGTTWEKILVYEHPYPLFDPLTTNIEDTLWATDGGLAVALDADGNAHVAFGLTAIMYTAPGPSFSYWPFFEGMVYWNENMPTIPPDPLDVHNTLHADRLYDSGLLVGWVQDVDGNGTVDIFDEEIMAYRTLGLSTMPTLHVDDNNVVFLIYSSVTEGFHNDAHYYKKLWARTSPDNGTTWGNFFHLTDDLIHMFNECIYPQLAQSSDEYIYYFFNVDDSPGLALDEDHPHQLNTKVFAKVMKSSIVGVQDQMINDNILNISMYPNPTSSHSRIAIENNFIAPITISLHNIVGKEVLNIDGGVRQPGLHVFDLDVRNLNRGIYLITILSGEQKTVKKLVVN